MAYTPPAAKSTGDTLSAAEFNTLAAAVDSVDANVVTTLTLAGGITGSKPAGSNTLTLDTNNLAPKASPTFTGTVTVPTPTVTGAAATKGYVDTAVSSAGGVPTTRNIIAGTGLTGGGTLAADRTLAVNVAAGSDRDAAKMVASNDPRIVYVASGYTTATLSAALAAAPASASIVLVPIAE